MKAKVIIENRTTTIVLSPENKFETDLIEKIQNNRGKQVINTFFHADYNFGSYHNHYIELSITEE